MATRIKVVIQNVHFHQCSTCSKQGKTAKPAAAKPAKRSAVKRAAAKPVKSVAVKQSSKRARGRPPSGISSAAAASARVKRERGAPNLQACVHCCKPAAVWSLDKTATGTELDSYGRAYSNDLDAYLPKCRKCSRIGSSLIRVTPQATGAELERELELAREWDQVFSQ